MTEPQRNMEAKNFLRRSRSQQPPEVTYRVRPDRAAAIAQLKDYHELAKRLMAAADKGQLEEKRVIAEDPTPLLLGLSVRPREGEVGPRHARHDVR